MKNSIEDIIALIESRDTLSREEFMQITDAMRDSFPTLDIDDCAW